MIIKALGFLMLCAWFIGIPAYGHFNGVVTATAFGVINGFWAVFIAWIIFSFVTYLFVSSALEMAFFEDKK